jgi:hypothetical protein
VSNKSGQAYAFMAITPILPGREAELRILLEGFTQQTSPFASLKHTHFGRWVILSGWNDNAQPRQDTLGSEYLIFTSNLDAPLERYLDALCRLPVAGEIWQHCVGCPKPAEGTALKAYLLHNQIDIGFFVAAYDELSVEEVQSKLVLRERLSAFAVSSQGLDPASLQSAFNAEFGRA